MDNRIKVIFLVGLILANIVRFSLRLNTIRGMEVAEMVQLSLEMYLGYPIG